MILSDTVIFVLQQLVPTRVGMILGEIATACEIKTCPHTRGDDP